MFAEKSKTLKRMFLNAMQLQSITSAKTAEGGVAVTTSAQRKDSHSKDDLCPESPVLTSDESDDSILGRVKKKTVSFAIDVLPDRNPTDDKEQIVQNNHDTDDCNIAVDEITETDEYYSVEQISNESDTAVEKFTDTCDNQITDTDEDGIIEQATDEGDTTMEQLTNTNKADTAINKPTNTDEDDTVEFTNEGDTAVGQIIDTDKVDTIEQITDPNEDDIEQVTDSNEGDAVVAQHATKSYIEQCQTLSLKKRKGLDAHNKPFIKKVTCFVCNLRVHLRSLRWHMKQFHGYSFATLDDCLNLYKQRDKKIAQSELRRYANYLAQNICEVCKKPYSTKNNLKRHLMNIHDYNHMDLDKYFDKTRKYKVKKKISRQQNSSMACHSHSSDINSGPICKLCRRKFKNTDMLFLHLRTFHKYSLKKLRQYFNTCTDKPTLETECDSQEVSIQSVAHTDKQIEQETEIKNQMSSPQTVDLAVGSRPPLLEGTNNINCYKNKKRYLRVCKYCKEDYKSKDLLRLHLSMWRTKCYELYRARNISKSNSQKVSSQSVAHTDNQIEQETDGNSRILSHINTSDDQTVEGQYPSEGTSHNSYEIEKRGVICIYCHKKYTPSEFFQHMRSGFCTTKYNDSNNIMFIETKHGGHEVANSRNAQIEEQIEQETEINNQMSSPKTKSVGLTVGSPKVSSHIIVQTDDQTEQKTEINSQLLSRDQTIGGQTSEGTINDSYKKVKKRRVVCTFCKKKYKSRELLWKHIRNGLCKNHPTITKQDTGRKISSGGIVQIVEENEHGLGTESNSQILKKVSPTVGQDELRVAILKADGNQLNEKQATKVKNLLQRKILTEAKEQFSSSAFLPCFTTEAAFSDGVLKLECKDDLTVKWLRNAVQNLRYYIDKFPKLTLIRQCELNKVSVTLSLPDCDSSLDDVMLVLNRQNKWAFVDTWTVRTHNLLSNGTMFLALAIPEDVFPLLEKENLRLFYNLGSVKLRPYNCYEAVTSKQSSRKEKGRINKNNSRGKYAA